MKKILFIATIFAFTQFATAQKKNASKPAASSSSSSSKSYGEGFGQGDWVISGQFGYGSEEKSGVSTSTLAIVPSVGYFLKENIALVGTLGIENTSAGGGSSSNTLIVGAAVRYYLTPASKFSLFGQGGLVFRSNDAVTKINLGVQPGFNYFVAKNFSLEATFGDVGIVNTSPKGGNGSTDFKFGIDMTNLGLGLNYRF